MEKIKIVVWGISDGIWTNIKKSLDFEKTSILCFVDNDPLLDGLYLDDIKIVNYGDEAKNYIEEAECIVIAAYSGFQEIKRQLVEEKVQEEKIQLYITEGLKSYYIGVISNISYGLIEKIYLEPLERKNILKQYLHDVKIYEEEKPVNNKYKNWSEKCDLISHACGGYVNGRKLSYTNSAEALEYSLMNNFGIIECDIWKKAGDEVICMHDYEKIYNSKEEKYTIQTIDTVIEKMSKYMEKYLLIDIKWDEVEEYEYCVKRIENIIGNVGCNVKSRIVIEAYDEKTINVALRYGFNIFFTLYRNPHIGHYMEIANICTKYGISAVGFGFEYLTKHYKNIIPIFKRKNIKVLGYSCNSLDDYREMKRRGLDGIFTDFLRR